MFIYVYAYKHTYRFTQTDPCVFSILYIYISIHVCIWGCSSLPDRPRLRFLASHTMTIRCSTADFACPKSMAESYTKGSYRGRPGKHRSSFDGIVIYSNKITVCCILVLSYGIVYDVNTCLSECWDFSNRSCACAICARVPRSTSRRSCAPSDDLD